MGPAAFKLRPMNKFWNLSFGVWNLFGIWNLYNLILTRNA
jgi:hypothetical protein